MHPATDSTRLPMCGLVLLLTVLALAVPAFAQEFWVKKNYTEWSEKECRKLLEDSPWARTQLISSISLRALTLPQAGADPSAGGPPGRESNPRITYTAQVRSAMPVRQAIVRLQQISAKYSAMDSQQKMLFDEQAHKFLAVRFVDAIVIFVDYASNVPPFQSELARHWRSVTPELARNQIFLITETGRKIAPIQVTHQSDSGFHLVFPRLVDNEPVIGPRAKEFKLEFPHPNIGELGAARILLSFKPENMQIDGKPAL